MFLKFISFPYINIIADKCLEWRYIISVSVKMPNIEKKSFCSAFLILDLWTKGSSCFSYLLQEKIKHEDETIQIHFIIFTIKVNSPSSWVSKILERATKWTTHRTPKWTLKRTMKWTQHIVLYSSTRIRGNTHLEERTLIHMSEAEAQIAVSYIWEDISGRHTDFLS